MENNLVAITSTLDSHPVFFLVIKPSLTTTTSLLKVLKNHGHNATVCSSVDSLYKIHPSKTYLTTGMDNQCMEMELSLSLFKKAIFLVHNIEDEKSLTGPENFMVPPAFRNYLTFSTVKRHSPEVVYMTEGSLGQRLSRVFLENRSSPILILTDDESLRARDLETYGREIIRGNDLDKLRQRTKRPPIILLKDEEEIFLPDFRGQDLVVIDTLIHHKRPVSQQDKPLVKMRSWHREGLARSLGATKLVFLDSQERVSSLPYLYQWTRVNRLFLGVKFPQFGDTDLKALILDNKLNKLSPEVLSVDLNWRSLFLLQEQLDLDPDINLYPIIVLLAFLQYNMPLFLRTPSPVQEGVYEFTGSTGTVLAMSVWSKMILKLGTNFDFSSYMHNLEEWAKNKGLNDLYLKRVVRIVEGAFSSPFALRETLPLKKDDFNIYRVLEGFEPYLLRGSIGFSLEKGRDSSYVSRGKYYTLADYLPQSLLKHDSIIALTWDRQRNEIFLASTLEAFSEEQKYEETAWSILWGERVPRIFVDVLNNLGLVQEESRISMIPIKTTSIPVLE